MNPTDDNPFVKPASAYKRRISPVVDYIQDAARYVSIMTGDPYEKCVDYVRTNLKPGGRFELKDPGVQYFQRLPNGDREKRQTPILDFLGDVIKENEIMSPSWVAYTHPTIMPSIIAGDTEDKIKLRSTAKKAMFAAEGRNPYVYTLKKIEQGARKTSNNAYSGATCTPSTPLFNRSAHTSLTSTCRNTSGFGNANNEKLLSGNRHYRSYTIVVNNIISIINHTDYQALSAAIAEFDLKIPSAEEVMDCILYSTRLYWRNTIYENKLRTLVFKLEPLQRAAFVYTGDLYHLKMHNDSVLRDLIDNLSMRIDGELADPWPILKAANDEFVNLSHQICTSFMAGKNKDYTLLTHEERCTLALTQMHIAKTVARYGNFFRVFFRTDNVPASVSYFPDSIRRVVPTSDTDSTIFTAQMWVIWFMGRLDFSPKGVAVQAAMTFLAANTIIHVLAVMSGHMNIEEKNIFRISMKSEYRFDLFCPTQIGKTYFATIGAQEGNIKAEPEREIKGVQLKSSNAPEVLNKRAEKMMCDIMDTVMAGNKISIVKILTEIADVERDVMASIKRGETTYLRRGSIKSPESYTAGPEESNYQNHTLWEKIFQPKYGSITPPPYNTAKISLTTKDHKLMAAWIASIPDRAIAERIGHYFLSKGKTEFTTFHAPIEVLKSSGIPAEIEMIVDYRKIVGELMNSFRLILGVLNYDVRWDPDNPTLISDTY